MQTTCKPSGENMSTSTMHFLVQSHIRALHSTLRWWHFSISVTWTWIQAQPPLQAPLLVRRLPKVDVWESFMVSIKSFDLCGLQHPHLWSRSMPRLAVHLEMAHSDLEGRMLLQMREAMVQMDSVYWVPGRRHLVHTSLFHLFTACEVGAIISKDEESVFLWDSGACLSAHGYSTPESTPLPSESSSCPLGPVTTYKTGLSSKSPWKLHPKDDKRLSLSYLDFTRDVTFSVIGNFLNLSRAWKGELLQSLQSWSCHHLDERSYQSLCQLPFKAYKTRRILLSFSLDHFPSQISSSPYFKRHTLPITFSTAQQKVPINQHPWSQPCLRGRQPDCLLKQVTIVYQ